MKSATHNNAPRKKFTIMNNSGYLFTYKGWSFFGTNIFLLVVIKIQLTQKQESYDLVKLNKFLNRCVQSSYWVALISCSLIQSQFLPCRLTVYLQFMSVWEMSASSFSLRCIEHQMSRVSPEIILDYYYRHKLFYLCNT